MTHEYPFKLGAKVFQLLVDIFLLHDFSVMNYVSSLQVRFGEKNESPRLLINWRIVLLPLILDRLRHCSKTYPEEN